MIVSIEPVTNLPIPDNSDERSAGVHVSEVIRCISLEMGILKYELIEEIALLSKKDMSGLDIVSQLRIHMGFAWDAYYIPLIPGVKVHPGEVKASDIYMTPDGVEQSVIITGDGPIKRRKPYTKIHEVKCTYKSTNTVGDFRSQFMWISQIKSYCHGYNTTLATSHVLFVCGDYVMPIQPQLIKYHLEFTKQEIADNWSLITDYRDLRVDIEGPKQLAQPMRKLMKGKK